MSAQDPTADYRKYPKSPSFLTVVLLSCVALLVVIFGAYFLVRHHESKMTTRPPEPTPNSLAQPLTPDGSGRRFA